MAPAALVGGLVLAAVGALLVDIPALALGVNVSSSHLPPGLTIADTAVQDAGFVAVALYFAQLGGRKVDATMFGLRPTRLGRAVWLVVVLLVGFVVFSVIWTSVFHASREKLLEQLGANETTALLVLSAALTCVVAPFAEEFLFRGFIFTALRNWRGVLPAALITGLLFGAVHAGRRRRSTSSRWPRSGSACVCCTARPARCTRASPRTASTNTIAFGSLEEWGLWQVAVLMASALAVLTVAAIVLTQLGIASRERAVA